MKAIVKSWYEGNLRIDVILAIASTYEELPKVIPTVYHTGVKFNAVDIPVGEVLDLETIVGAI